MRKDLTANIKEKYLDVVFNPYPPFPKKRMKIEISDACNHSRIFSET
jgi:hypothetical protein